MIWYNMTVAYPKGIEVNENIIGADAHEDDDRDDVEEGEKFDRQKDHVDWISRRQIQENETTRGYKWRGRTSQRTS